MLFPGWLEPLLDRIAEDPTNVVTPVIDVISDETLELQFSGSDSISVGGFDWNLQVHFFPIFSSPVESVQCSLVQCQFFANCNKRAFV